MRHQAPGQLGKITLPFRLASNKTRCTIAVFRVPPGVAGRFSQLKCEGKFLWESPLVCRAEPAEEKKPSRESLWSRKSAIPVFGISLERLWQRARARATRSSFLP